MKNSKTSSQLALALKRRRRRARSELVLEPEILLSDSIPEPMHGVNPRSILGAAWWNKTRQEAYHHSLFCCLACGIKKQQARRQQLHGHEVYGIDYSKGHLVYFRTVALCVDCHDYVHKIRLQALLCLGQITHSRFVSVIQHGDGIISMAGLVKLPVYNGHTAVWKDWRMILNGKEYPPKYKNAGEWKRSFQNAKS